MTSKSLPHTIDIVCSCACAFLQAALGPDGAVAGITAGKDYVDMSTVDENTAKQIAAAVAEKGGRFLEVSMQASTGFSQNIHICQTC